MAFKYDFCGYATKNDLLCSDGRTIRKDAFADQDGEIVPLVWNHDHREIENVLGHALLENKDDGVYAYGVFNDTRNGQNARALVAHGDIVALSIYANHLKQRGNDVLHGKIRELSLVYAGANPGAYIDSVIAHGEDDEEAVIYSGENLILEHGEIGDKMESSKNDDRAINEIIDTMTDKKRKVAKFIIDTASQNKEFTQMASHTDENSEEPAGETILDVWETFTEEEKNAVYTIIGSMRGETANNTNKQNENDEEEPSMRHNAFDTNTQTDSMDGILTHDDQTAILNMARSNNCGSLQAAISTYSENCDHLQHGIEQIETLFPEYKDVKPGAPEVITDDLGWVSNVMDKVHKSPISRLRTRQADARNRAMRGMGYKKGAQKKDTGNVKLLKRTTDPTTVYIKDAMNRDDILDITDFDVVNYEYALLRSALNEELATAIMVGDGREDGDELKIPEDKIRPIWTDDELYTIHQDVDVKGMKESLNGTNTSANFGDEYIKAEAIIQANLNARLDYKGSGNLTMYCCPRLLNMMMMARDLNGRRIYGSLNELKAALNVSDIQTVEQFEGLERKDANTKKHGLLAIFVNLNDYYVGSTKGGQITQFSQFDIDYNKEKYLIETRVSGALVKIKSAIVLEEPVDNME